MAGDTTEQENLEEGEPEAEHPTLEELAQRRSYPEYDLAIQRNDASFDQLAEVHCWSLEKFNPDDEVGRLAFQRYEPQLMKAFENTHGGIASTYWCGNLMAGVVMTKTGELWHAAPLGRVHAADELLLHCERIRIAAWRLLEGRELLICVDMLYGIITDLLGIIDRQEGDNPPDSETVSATMKLIGTEIDRVEDFHKRSAQRSAQLNYFLGMLGGIAAVSTATLIFLLVSRFLGASQFAVVSLSASLIMGGVGAVLSVLSRMHGGRLQLDYQTGPRFLKLLGAFRPVIGSVMGAALLILILSGILPIVIPTDADLQLYFFAGVAFLAGFSERFAQDMLVKSSERLGKASGAGG